MFLVKWAVPTAGLLWCVRRFVQGYWIDSACISMKDLSGQTAVITGGNSGVGLEAAVGLAKRGANVVIACRNEERAKSGVKTIQTRSGSSNVSYKLVDMAVSSFAREYRASGEPVHILLSNAGIHDSETTWDGQGFHPVWKVNYLSAYLLISLLLPTIKESSRQHPCRIVSVASGAHTRADISFEDPNTNSFQSKLAQIMHMKELQKRLDAELPPGERGSPILAVSCTPGMTHTPLMDSFFSKTMTRRALQIIFAPILWCLTRSPDTGAQVILHCCLDDTVKGGAYYSNCAEKPTTGIDNISNNEEAWGKLWELSRESVKDYLN